MPPTIRISDALTKLLFLRRTQIIEVDIIQQPLLQNLP